MLLYVFNFVIFRSSVATTSRDSAITWHVSFHWTVGELPFLKDISQSWIRQSLLARGRVCWTCYFVNLRTDLSWRAANNSTRHEQKMKSSNFVFIRNHIARISGATVKNINRRLDQITLNIEDLERFERNFRTAINQGFAEGANGQRIPLDDNNGIDVLGDMMEASILTPNRNLYGDLHNFAHIILSVSCVWLLSMLT